MTGRQNDDCQIVQLSSSLEEIPIDDYEPDLSGMIPDPQMPEKNRKFVEIIAHLGIFLMKVYIDEKYRVGFEITPEIGILVVHKIVHDRTIKLLFGFRTLIKGQ